MTEESKLALIVFQMFGVQVAFSMNFWRESIFFTLQTTFNSTSESRVQASPSLPRRD